MEKDLNVAEVCASFGHFVKFIVSVEKPGENSGVTVSRNAIAIMMCSQHSACQPSLPNPLVERTRKDKLFNNILQLVAILCELFLIGPNPHSPVMLRFNLTFLCVPHFWTYIYAMEIMLFAFMFMHIYMLRQ